MINRAMFFAGIRSSVFGGSLSGSAVTGINAILDEWERRKLTDLRWLAYMLATAKGEVGSNMIPVREGFATSDVAARVYVAKQKYKYAVVVNGQVYYGRGLVQLTWETNYRKMGALLGLDLVGNPDLALRPEIASMIMFEGMTRGTFTGKKLADYFTPSKTDWLNARRIINGTDKAEQFAVWARAFYTALIKADQAVITAPAKPADSSKPVAGAVAGGAVIVAGGASAASVNGISAVEILMWIGGLSLVAGVTGLGIYRYIKGSWPWTGNQSQAQLPLSPQSSGLSSAQLSQALLAVQSAVSPEVPLPASSASKKPRKRSAKPSRKTRTQPRKSASLKRTGAKKSARKPKLKSKG